ncbi:MAG: PAS domain-containing protein [Gammaproteobacteria bacterium]
MASVQERVARSVTAGKPESHHPVSAWAPHESDVMALLVLDHSGRIRYLNHAATEMLGVSLEQVRGTAWVNCVNVVESATRTPIRDPVKACLDAGTPLKIGCNAILVSPSGRDIAVEVYVEPFPELDGAVMMFRDDAAATAAAS